MASVEKRATGSGLRWRVVWYEDGAKQRVTFTDPDEAARFRKLVEGSGGRWPTGWTRPTGPVPPTPPDALTFDRWARQAIAARPRASDRTKADYLRALDRHFAELAGRPLDEVTTDDVASWHAARVAAGMAEKSVRNWHGFASSIFADAIRHRPPLAEHNPFAEYRLRDRAAVHVEEMVMLTPQEFGHVLQYVRDEYAPLIRLLAGTGLRFGEATALTVGDVDILTARRALSVTKAWKRIGATGWTLGEPKTQRSRRTVSLSDELVDLLIPLVAGRRRDDLLFSHRDTGTVRLPHIEVWKRGWAPAVARARVCDVHYAPQRNKRGKPLLMPAPCGCPGVLEKQPRMHDLRHSHASWLISDGLPLPAISRRLGHSSITITIDRYGHLDPALDEQINAAVDRALRRNRPAADSLV